MKVVAGPRSPTRKSATFRHNATFAHDPRPYFRALDRNERARIVFLCEALERRTKGPGQRNGQLGYTGLAVLRALIFGFLNRATGALYPSYDAIQRRTGFCRSSIAHALARLERCGVLTITRRLCARVPYRRFPISSAT